jgi:hypothetical protein
LRHSLETPKLKPLLLTVRGDTVELKSGVSIQIDSNVAKLAHGAIAVIELADGPASDAVTELKSDAEIARDTAHILLCGAHAATPDPIAINMVKMLFKISSDEEALERLRSFGKSDGR